VVATAGDRGLGAADSGLAARAGGLIARPDVVAAWRSRVAGPGLIAVCVLAGGAVAVLRLLSMTGFSNDHFFYLSRASQLLTGAWTVRDFVDPGFPLALAVSAAAQAIGGPTLLSEAVLVAVAFGVSAAVTVWVIARWLESLPLALWAAFVQTAVFPLSYSYPKLLMYALAAAAMFRYARTPSRAGLAALAATTAIAFLFRHDHGIYIGAAAGVLVAAVPIPGSAMRPSGRLAGLATLAFLIVAPYLVYVQTQGGLADYLANGLHFSAREADRTWSLLPPLDGGPVWSAVTLSSLGYYLVWAMPLAALAVMPLTHFGPSSRRLAVAFVVVAIAANAGFLRDPLVRRLADTVVPFTLLASWFVASVWRAPWRSPTLMWGVRAALLLFLAVTAAAAGEIGNFDEMVRRTAVANGPRRMLAHARTIVGELRAPDTERQMPSDLAYALVPFYRYVQACTPGTARLLVTGFAPEISYYARRGFAGGHPSLYRGYWSSERAQRAIVDRLQRELVPFVVASPEGVGQFAGSFPIVNDFVAAHYVPLAEFEVDGQESPARVYVDRHVRSAAAFGDTGWPCAWPQHR
jgi:hypothetical protein